MGLFSLDLSQPVIVTIHDKDVGVVFKEDVEKFIM